jgi:hypothetical protein
MRQVILYLLVFLAACSPKSRQVQAPVPEPRPAWVQQRPVQPGYYLGIGVARKINGGFEHMEQAKKNAFNDLVSQIQVTVQANSIQSQLERNRVFTDEFRSFTRLSSNVAIEDYELVDSWQNEQEYWIYYRLSINDFQRQRERRMQKAMAQSLDAYERAGEAARSGDLLSAYDFYFRALDAIKAHVGDPLTYEADGRQRFLGNDLIEAINKLSRDIAIRVNVQSIKGKLGQPVNQEILITVAHPRENGEPVTNFPLNIRFLQGAGTIIGNRSTDLAGVCRIRIANITARDALQEIVIEPDLASLSTNNKEREAWLRVIDAQSMPRGRLIVEVTPPVIQLMSKEAAFGKARNTEQLQGVARMRLQRDGIRFNDRSEGIDYRIMIESDVKRGPVNSGMHTALLDMRVVLVDATGQEKYSQTLTGIRGVQLDDERAAEAAYRRAAEDLELTVIPRIINIIFNL